MSFFPSTANSYIRRVDLFNQAVTANTNILSTPITFSVQPQSLGWIYICATNAGSLSIKRTLFTSGTTTETYAAEIVNQPNYHPLQASFNEQLNFQYSVNTTLSKFTVCEVMPLTFHS